MEDTLEELAEELAEDMAEELVVEGKLLAEGRLVEWRLEQKEAAANLVAKEQMFAVL